VGPYGFELARPGKVPLTRRDDIMSSSSVMQKSSKESIAR
jgi:hypothetical protein